MEKDSAEAGAYWRAFEDCSGDDLSDPEWETVSNDETINGQKVDMEDQHVVAWPDLQNGSLDSSPVPEMFDSGSQQLDGSSWEGSGGLDESDADSAIAKGPEQVNHELLVEKVAKMGEMGLIPENPREVESEEKSSVEHSTTCDKDSVADLAVMESPHMIQMCSELGAKDAEIAELKAALQQANDNTKKLQELVVQLEETKCAAGPAAKEQPVQPFNLEPAGLEAALFGDPLKKMQGDAVQKNREVGHVSGGVALTQSNPMTQWLGPFPTTDANGGNKPDSSSEGASNNWVAAMKSLALDNSREIEELEEGRQQAYNDALKWKERAMQLEAKLEQHRKDGGKQKETKELLVHRGNGVSGETTRREAGRKKYAILKGLKEMTIVNVHSGQDGFVTEIELFTHLLYSHEGFPGGEFRRIVVKGQQPTFVSHLVKHYVSDARTLRFAVKRARLEFDGQQRGPSRPKFCPRLPSLVGKDAGQSTANVGGSNREVTSVEEHRFQNRKKGEFFVVRLFFHGTTANDGEADDNLDEQVVAMEIHIN